MNKFIVFDTIVLVQLITTTERLFTMPTYQHPLSVEQEAEFELLIIRNQMNEIETYNCLSFFGNLIDLKDIISKIFTINSSKGKIV